MNANRPADCRPLAAARRRRPTARPFAAALARATILATIALGVGGCAVGGVMAEAFAPKLPKEHDLAAVPTLIMVEDRGLAFEDPDLGAFIANAIAADLREHDALGGAPIVEQSKLAALAAEFDRDFESVAIDAVGQRVGASQVLYVALRRVRLQQAPGLYQPQAVAEVKVIDAVSRKRVFPPPRSVDGVSVVPRGRAVVAELPPDAADTGDRSYAAAKRRQLARAVATKVAELFYDRKRRQPGDRLPG